MSLILIATPIGNLSDLSARAAEELRRADIVACEDTRRTGRLLHHLGLTGTKLLRIDDHTEVSRTADVLARLARGERVAVVTDAGTPGISDPGERLVRAAVEAGHPVEVIPGPSAVITALVGSGLPTGRFCFEGFLPRRGSGRTERVAALAREERTIVLYEAPHRAARTVSDLVAACGPDRPVAIARELTKLHEEWWRGSLGAAVDWLEEHPPRGEITLVVGGAPPPSPAGVADVEAALAAELAAGTSVRDAAVAIAARFGVSRRDVYRLAVSRERPRR